MDDARRNFLGELLETPSPSGYETSGQQVWTSYVTQFADEVRTDEYGNAVAVLEGDGPAVAVGGHADEIGFIVRRIDDEGYVHLGRIGGSDATVSRGQHVEIHAEDDTVPGVVGQTAIHLREEAEPEADSVDQQKVDIGADDGEAARELVDVGDPITFSSTVTDLAGTRIAARGLDNRAGTWTAAEALRLASRRDVDATVYAVSTVQEELGKRGAKMIGFDLEPDAAIAVDVTHASDYPEAPGEKGADVDLGAGPVIGRGSTNHPVLVDLARAAADEEEIDVQLAAAGRTTGTDADAFAVARGATPSLNLGLPNRYMHTPVEVVDTDDLDAASRLLAGVLERAADYDDFGVEV